MDFNEDIALIKDVLTKGLSHIKPKPKIWIEVNERGSGLRMWVISRGFAKMLLHDRYDLVFSLFDQKLNRETEKKITSLLIYTPKEMHYEMPWERPNLSKSDADVKDLQVSAESVSIPLENSLH